MSLPSHRRDLGGDQFLQPPQIAVADPELAELQNRVVEIGGVGTDMAASPRDAAGSFLEWQPAKDKTAFRAGPETECPDFALIGLRPQPSDGSQILGIAGLP